MSTRPAWIAWRYLMVRHLASFLVVTAVIVFLFFCISLAEFGRRDAGGDIPFLVLIEMSLLQVPSNLFRTIPLVFLIGMLWSHMHLSKRTTIAIFRSAGFTPYHTAVPVIGAAILVGSVLVIVFNPISASLTARLDRLESFHYRGVSSRLELSEFGIWLRQFSGSGQSVIHAESVTEDGGILLRRPQLFGFDRFGDMTLHVAAKEAVLWDGFWEFADALIHIIPAAESGSLPEGQSRTRYWYGTSLNAAHIMDTLAAPEAISIWRIREFIASLVSAGFDARRHRMYLHDLASLPLVLLAMGLVGCMAGMGFNLRTGRYRIVLALVAGLSMYLVLYVVDTAAVAGRVPLVLAHWCAVGAILLASLGALLHWEPG